MSFFQARSTGGRRVERRVDQNLIRGIVRQVDSHNKTVEEREMWQEWERQKEQERRQAQFRYESARRRHNPDEGRPSDRRAKRRPSPHRDRSQRASHPSSTYWQRQLLAAEEADPDRWGHTGFRELYADELAQAPHTREVHAASLEHGDAAEKSLRERLHAKHGTLPGVSRSAGDSPSDTDTGSSASDAGDKSDRKKKRKRRQKRGASEERSSPVSDEEHRRHKKRKHSRLKHQHKKTKKKKHKDKKK